MKTIKLTTAQALIRYLSVQYSERDQKRQRFFAGCFGILGHGNIAGIGQALDQEKLLTYYQSRNEQSMVHAAAAYAKVNNRLSTIACTSSVGPGATNMITAAAAATINRLPVLLLPGDIFSKRHVAPVLQQLESPYSQDFSVNDCFKPISQYWDRLNRPEQLLTALPEAMRVLTCPAQTGTVTLSLPQDVQVEAFDFPASFFEETNWTIGRHRPDKSAVEHALKAIAQAKQPLIIIGGGAHYSEALEIITKLVDQTGIPVAETFAGKGGLPFNHKSNLGALGVTGTPGANLIAKEADLVIGIGTRYSDFTTASKSAFQNEKVRFININVTSFDAAKHHALMLVGDAKATIEELIDPLKSYRVSNAYESKVQSLANQWDIKVTEVYAYRHQPQMSQGEIIGAVNSLADDNAIMVAAAGSLPGDLHKLWRTKNTKGFHLEYGYSCMGYEIAGGLGAKMASPEREVFVLVGDASYLMLAQEIVTSIQENLKLIIVLIDNNGYKSIGSLSRSIGGEGFGTRFLFRDPQTQSVEGDLASETSFLPVNLADNARSLGAHVIVCADYDSLISGIKEAKVHPKTTLIYTTCDRYQAVEGYGWWHVPVAEIAHSEKVNAAREANKPNQAQQRFYY